MSVRTIEERLRWVSTRERLNCWAGCGWPKGWEQHLNIPPAEVGVTWPIASPEAHTANGEPTDWYAAAFESGDQQMLANAAADLTLTVAVAKAALARREHEESTCTICLLDRGCEELEQLTAALDSALAALEQSR